ncbi:MAG: hypothetical protein ACT4P2_03415 [Pseudomonadota bacterium]
MPCSVPVLSSASPGRLARLVGVATPMLDAVVALVQQRGRLAGLYAPPAPPMSQAVERFASRG